jgi:hypothetical protein
MNAALLHLPTTPAIGLLMGMKDAKVLITEGIRSLTEPRQLTTPPVQPRVTKEITSFLRMCRVGLVKAKGSTEVDRVYEPLR